MGSTGSGARSAQFNSATNQRSPQSFPFESEWGGGSNPSFGSLLGGNQQDLQTSGLDFLSGLQGAQNPYIDALMNWQAPQRSQPTMQQPAQEAPVAQRQRPDLVGHNQIRRMMQNQRSRVRNSGLGKT